jgi:outer membrane protein assembly factor BamE (lipoprotein component of BamABCDE complex)
MTGFLERRTKHASPLVRLALLAGCVLPIAGCIGYDGTVQRGYVADAKAVDQLKPGLAKEQVLAQLGTPSTTSTVGGDAWYYISQKITRAVAFMPDNVSDQRVLAVYFNKGKLERVANYGVEDGKVFDYISRTTPTAGAETSFVQNMLRGLLKFN